MDIGAVGRNGRIAVSHVVTVIERDLENAMIQNPCVEVCTVQDRQPHQMAVLWRDVSSVRIIFKTIHVLLETLETSKWFFEALHWTLDDQIDEH